jgi:eukaryotic-like serine/threonine-protein kinase
VDEAQEHQEIGQRRFGRYELLYRFASGGMADLYLARARGEEQFERLVAVKIIHSHLSRQPEFVKMFIDEARLAARISHPNVVLILDLGKVTDCHFMAMEYIDGESVAALLRRARPPLPVAARIISEASAGLHAAHELSDLDGEALGVVHRDVSPQNILISYEGAVKVVDFGVARARGSLHTTSSSFKGKFGYMAPEQVENPRAVDRRTDVFALGVVLFEATTRRRLFRGETEAQTVDRVLRAPIPHPRDYIPDYPPALEEVALRALRRKPEERYQTARELHLDLERFITSCGETVPTSAVRVMMQELFADRIKTKRELLIRSKSEASSVVPDVDVVSGSSGSQVTGSRPSSAPPRRSRVPWYLAALALLAAGGAIGLLVLRETKLVASAQVAPGTATPQPEPKDPTPPESQPAPRSITISVRTAPTTATLLLDGKPVSNPFRLQRPAGTGHAELTVDAPGYQKQELRLPLDTGGEWNVELTPVPVAKRPVIKRPPRKGTRPAHKKDEGYLDNPYK